MGLRDRLFKKSDDNVDIQPVKKRSSYNYDVHISYSTKNNIVAQEICHVLEQNNLKCWIAPRNIASGKIYTEEIADGIKNSAIEVLVFSRDSMESKFVLHEIQMAFNLDKPIIAFKIDETFPKGEMEFFLKTKHWIDAYPSYQDSYELLIRDVLNLLNEEDDSVPIEEPKESLIVKNKVNKKNSDVYISYSENDVGVVGEICDSLEDHNISCWLKDRHDDSASLITACSDAIGYSRAFVLIFSSYSKQSSVVNTEVDMAFAKDIPIIWLQIDESKLDGGLEFFLSNKNRIDASSNFKKGLDSLVENVLRIVPPSLPDSHITFSSTSNSVLVGGVIVLSGTLNGESEKISGANVDIYQKRELADTVISSRSGNFSAVIPVNAVGSYDFKAIFKGNDEYNGCESESVTVDVVEEVIQDQSQKRASYIDNSSDDENVGDVEDGLLHLTDEDIGENYESIPHVDLVPFPAYEGKDAYAFVSYSHMDYEIVYDEIERFHNQGLNIWYDEGISPGNEWLAEIGEALRDASLFIVFISNNSVASRFVRKEITFAINNNIPFIAIYIEDTELPIQLDLALSDIQAILKFGMNEKEYYRRYTKAFNRILKDYGIKLKRVESLVPDKEVVESQADVGKSVLEDDAVEVQEDEKSVLEDDAVEVQEDEKSVLDDDVVEISELPIKSAPFPAYTGDEPYIFAAYSHMDSPLIFPELKRLNDLGYNIWYDEGITPGMEWDEEIANAILNSSLLIVFFTQNAVDSQNVRNEIFLALDKKKPVIPIYMEKTELKSGLRLSLSNTHSISKYLMNDDDYVFECVKAFEKCNISRIGAEGDGSIKSDEEFPDENLNINNELIPSNSNRFRAYSGDEPYMFVSYAHKDFDNIISDLNYFNDLGYNISYDEGIAPGSGWDDEIVNAISNSSLFVVFISKNSIASVNVLDEVKFALYRGLFIVPIFLEDVDLPLSLELRLSGIHSILKYLLSDEDYISQCLKAFEKANISRIS